MTLRVRSKIWLENDDGKMVVGTGRVRILEAIEEEGSINKAAKKIKQPFRAVWAKIKSTEERYGFSVVESNASGTKLTEQGLELLKRYRQVEACCEEYVDVCFSEIFGGESADTADEPITESPKSKRTKAGAPK